MDKKHLLAYYQAQRVDRERMYTKPFRRYQQRRRLEVTRNLLQEAHCLEGRNRILDVGCGDGYGSSVVLRDLPHTLFVGLDLSAEKLKSACHNLSPCQAVIGDAEGLPFPDETFDVVLSLETLEHLLEPSDALEEITRVLRPGGTLFLSVPVSSRFNAAISRWLMKLRQTGKFHEHLQVYTLKAMLDLLRAAGLRPMGRRFCVFNYPCYELLTRLVPYRLWRRFDKVLSRWSMGVVGVQLGLSLRLGNEYLVVWAGKNLC